jgi:hypothetical protein
MLSTNTTCSLRLKIFTLSSVLNHKYKQFRKQFLIKIRRTCQFYAISSLTLPSIGTIQLPHLKKKLIYRQIHPKCKTSQLHAVPWTKMMSIAEWPTNKHTTDPSAETCTTQRPSCFLHLAEISSYRDWGRKLGSIPPEPTLKLQKRRCINGG